MIGYYRLNKFLKIIIFIICIFLLGLGFFSALVQELPGLIPECLGGPVILGLYNTIHARISYLLLTMHLKYQGSM